MWQKFKNWISSKLIPDGKLIWKRWSAWIVAAQGVLALLWLGLPAEWKPPIPTWGQWVLVAVLSAAALSVMPLKQPNLPEK